MYFKAQHIVSGSGSVAQGLEVKVWRDYDAFVAELGDQFPHEREGIRRFYDECWRVFDSLNRCAKVTWELCAIDDCV